MNIRGYNYYKPPPELKYRYPAPGSCAHDEEDHPNLYKKHWKTPYRESPYNIQKKEKKVTMAENDELYVSGFPEFNPSDPYDQAIMREVLPSYEGKIAMYEDFDKMTAEEKS